MKQFKATQDITFGAGLTPEELAVGEAAGFPVPNTIPAGTVLDELDPDKTPFEVKLARLLGLLPAESVLLVHPDDGEYITALLGTEVEELVEVNA